MIYQLVYTNDKKVAKKMKNTTFQHDGYIPSYDPKICLQGDGEVFEIIPEYIHYRENIICMITVRHIYILENVEETHKHSLRSETRLADLVEHLTNSSEKYIEVFLGHPISPDPTISLEDELKNRLKKISDAELIPLLHNYGLLDDVDIEEMYNLISIKLDNLDFSCGEIREQDGEYYLEIEKGTPLGEDWGFTVWFDGTWGSFTKAIHELAESFDVDEAVEVWIPNRGKNGTPSSIKALVEDAEWKRRELERLDLYFDITN